jgi:peptidoglycan/LPS O-acetylase OafA/YrhL
MLSTTYPDAEGRNARRELPACAEAARLTTGDAYPPPMAERVGAALRGRNNALNAVRLLLAGAVIVSHLFVTGGYGAEPRWGGYTLGGWAVMGFFGISGYLVTGSRLSNPLRSYLRRRCLRIYPGFWTCLVLTAFVLAPLSAVLDASHFAATSAAGYVMFNASLWMAQGDVDATLRHVPLPLVWNASAWTLAYEFLCYLVVGVGMSVARDPRWRRWSLWAGLALVTTLNLVAVHRGSSNGFLTLSLWLGAFFLAGGCVRMEAHRLPVSAWLAAASMALLVVASATGVVRALAPLPLTYIVLWLGATVRVRWGSRNDLSYGVYIYAFPVQQLLAAAGMQRMPWLYASSTFVLVSALAAASWWGVEKPSLALAHRGSARRTQAVMTT